jgi:hypothetical protein
MRSASLRLPAMIACAAALAGCSADPIEPRLSALQDRIFTPSCTFSTCHSAAANEGQLVLERGRSHAQLVGQPAVQQQAALERLVRVAAKDPEASFLLVKLRPRLPAKYGKHMPDAAGQLDADQLQAIEEWIRRGANDD